MKQLDFARVLLLDQVMVLEREFELERTEARWLVSSLPGLLES